MTGPKNRREFLGAAATATFAGSLSRQAKAAEQENPIRVVVWDERQPAQKQAYENFLGNAIADHLRARPGISVNSVCLDDPEQGIGDGNLDACDVLIWWGHVRQAEISPQVGQKIVGRIKAGILSLIALHSAHWSTPFVEAMYERTRMDVAAILSRSGDEQAEIEEVPPPKRYTVPKADAALTPSLRLRKFPGGKTKARVYLPLCCFPAYRADGKPSAVRVLKPTHPIAAGIPARFEIPQTEMYDEPFHVPEPDEVVFEERWEPGEWFRSGMVWNLGKGRVFYFRPGHETYPVYRQELPLEIIANATRWLAKSRG
ncbi:ThuA domain-containing protein [Singulisphaera sp. PoT]|uniref:ThuA domain-containing protein n=1 Tax=Singulisphaera sp. PoT TaxID=3411797 RepID=UPI003BF5D26C